MSLPSGLIDVEHSLAGDTPVAQLGADFCYVTPTVFGKDRFQRAVADKCSQQRQIGREPVLVLGGEIRETLDAGIGVLGEVAEAQWCGLAGRIAKDDDDKVCGMDGTGVGCLFLLWVLEEPEGVMMRFSIFDFRL